MAFNTNTSYYDNGSLSKPPRFSRDNFSLWKNRMMLFLEGADPTIPEYITNGPYEPVLIIPAIPATTTTPFVPERYVVKEIRQWSDEDKKKVGIDARAKTIISMALTDEVFHSIMHLKTSKEIWETICVQYEGTTEIQETRKINLVRQYESFIAGKNESLSDVHQRFNCLIIDLRTVGRTYSNSEASAACYNCEKIGHFASECKSKKVFKPSALRRSSDDKYLKLKEKYQKLKSYKQKSKGLIAEEHDCAESEESSSDGEEVANLCLMDEIKEEVEEPTETSMSYISSQVSISTNPSLPEEERSRVIDVLTIDLYNALNDKALAENKNIDLTEQLEKCHEKIRELTLLEESLKDQVIVNEIISIEREQAIAALNTEKTTVVKWCKSSTKITEVINVQTPGSDRTGLGFWKPQDEPKEESSMLKFGTFVTSISDTYYNQFYPPSSSNPIPEEISKGSKSADKGKSIIHPQKATKKAKLKLKIDLKPKRSEEIKIPPRSHEKSILGAGPAHLKFSKLSTSGPKASFKYKKCYHCGFTDHIANKCPTATKADETAKVKINASKAEKVIKSEKSTKVKNTTMVKKLTNVKITTEAESSSAVQIAEPSISTNCKGPIEKWVPNKA
ncbi:hypothetical protein L6452_02042 [Arctium lappa]|uniref:Uncharacterized protein n=1 Tax=Arctium lappa TaxID=4217 RepID=A0ACB9FHZ9_ARCLA|nr:hypothetical protein L6452_02042 [Arctium lappa]